MSTVPYFECQQCAELLNMSRFEQDVVRQHCPVCEEETTWQAAFESSEGVSF